MTEQELAKRIEETLEAYKGEIITPSMLAMMDKHLRNTFDGEIYRSWDIEIPEN